MPKFLLSHRNISHAGVMFFQVQYNKLHMQVVCLLSFHMDFWCKRREDGGKHGGGMEAISWRLALSIERESR